MSTSAILDSKAALKQLEEAISGLLYISESDAPFELVHVSGGTADFNAAAARKVVADPTAPAEQDNVADFFAVPTQAQDWHEEPEKADVARYRALKALFTDHLASSRVFRVGVVHVHFVIVGRASDGVWVGVKTIAVQT